LQQYSTIQYYSLLSCANGLTVQYSVVSIVCYWLFSQFAEKVQYSSQQHSDLQQLAYQFFNYFCTDACMYELCMQYITSWPVACVAPSGELAIQERRYGPCCLWVNYNYDDQYITVVAVLGFV